MLQKLQIADLTQTRPLVKMTAALAPETIPNSKQFFLKSVVYNVSWVSSSNSSYVVNTTFKNIVKNISISRRVTSCPEKSKLNARTQNEPM